MPRAFPTQFSGFRLVTVGRLHYQKAFDIAIDACARLIADGYPVRWYVLGEGAEREALEKQIRDRNLEDTFLLPGAVSNPYPYLRQADLYVHATRFEGKSIAIEEAQILQKPIVASDCTGNREQIQNGVDGILFPLSVDNLVQAIETVLDDPSLRERLSRNLASKTFDHPDQLRNLTQLLESQDTAKEAD